MDTNTEEQKIRTIPEATGDRESRKLRQRKKVNLISEYLMEEEEIFGDVLDEEYSESESEKVKRKRSRKPRSKALKEGELEAVVVKGDDGDHNGEANPRRHPRKRDHYARTYEKIENVISFQELKNKATVTNSDVILFIIHLCLNPDEFNITYPNDTRIFWDEVYQNNEIYEILKQYKPETMRKYWRIIRDVDDFHGVIDLVHKNVELINNPNFKLLPVINGIAECVKSKETNLEDFLYETDKPKTQKKSDEDRSNHLKKKRKNSGIEQDIKEIQMKIKGSKEANEVKGEGNSEDNNENKEDKNDTPVKDNTQECVAAIDECVNTFTEHFKNKSEEEVVNTLRATSMNIEKSYLYQCDSEIFKDHAFTNNEDYIVKHLKDKPNYEELVIEKGKEAVEQRERFLDVFK